MSHSTSDTIHELELAAFRAWPAEHVEQWDGWSLRATAGVTRRANSVFTSGGSLSHACAEGVAHAEAFYAARGLPARFQLTPVSHPPELDAELERRGYERESPVSIQTAQVAHVARQVNDLQVDVEATVSDAWLDVSARQGRFRDSEGVYRALLQRIGPSARFVVGRMDGVAAAVGLSVVDGSWCGIFSMLTLPEARRRGFGRSVLAAIALDAGQRGATGLYLQVERDNVPAQRLYAGLGFSERYGYHYRCRASAP